MTAPNDARGRAPADIVARLLAPGHGALADEAAAEIERLRAAQAWRPIETAPRDGTPILAVWCGLVTIAAWVTDAGEPNWQEYPNGDFEDIRGEEVTHWRPLPDAPA